MAGSGIGDTAAGFEVNETPDWDEVSLQTERAESGVDPDGPIKEMKLGVMKLFRESIRRVGEKKSPLTSRSKGSKIKSDMGSQGNGLDCDPDTQTHPPPSPSVSAGSPIASPLRGLSGVFRSPQNQKTLLSHSRTQSDSAVAIGDALLKKGAALRRSLRLGSKREKSPKPDALQSVTEATTRSEETRPQARERLEVRESYTLPEIPPTPLSVMQINKLIEMEVLEEAHLNLLSLRQEFQFECEALGEEAPMELGHKQKDLNLLYGALRNKMADIVRHSNTLPSRNKELLVHVARIIQEEERREGQLGGMGGWRDAWRAAVRDGVRDTLHGVHLEGREQNPSWLAVHLGLLGKAIMENLEKVKAELLGSYPPSFNVFNTYVTCCHDVVGVHLKKLLDKVTELKDYYALLDFIIHRYHSEKIMGSFSLRPELKEDQRALTLEDGFLEQIKSRYCHRLQEDMRASLDKVIELENEEMWIEKKGPEIDEEFYSSHIDMDVWTKIKGLAQGSRRIDADLEQRAVCASLKELKQFPKRFESTFTGWSSTLLDSNLWAEYHITYINSFCALKEHMEGYRGSSPEEVTQLGGEVDGLTLRLSQALLERFRTEIRPYLRRMMTRKWLSTDEDFQQLVNRLEQLSERCKHMRPPHAQTFVNAMHYLVVKEYISDLSFPLPNLCPINKRPMFVNDVHYLMVKEYISQLMKNNYSCKNRKHERAAEKLTEQWAELKIIFQEMRSTADWLHPVGDHLSKIIGQKNKSDIKNNLQPLVKEYPDISKRHLSAVLYFRGMLRGRERQRILQRLSELKRGAGTAGDQQHCLFSEIQAAVNTDCLAGMPFSCLSFLLPDS